MLDTHMQFTHQPLAGEQVLVVLDAQTNLPGQDFSTSVAMRAADWQHLQASAKALAHLVGHRVHSDSSTPQHVAEAYLAFALMNPQYDQHGAFSAAMFQADSRIFALALESATTHEADNRWNIAVAMQRAVLQQKRWAQVSAANATAERAR